jgi:hypothetical protein
VLRNAVAIVVAAWAAMRQPAVAIARTGAVTLTLPAGLIASPAVKEQLTSGLTTVFIVTATANDGSRDATGAARISIRLELWEERYIVSVADATGQQRSLTFASDADLAKWWSGSPLIVVAASRPLQRAPSNGMDVDVRLRMLPFSAREESDTRRWLSRNLSSASDRSAETPERSAAILRALVETSIRRRPLLEEHWKLRATRDSTP